jgi:hypothetical protein
MVILNNVVIYNGISAEEIGLPSRRQISLPYVIHTNRELGLMLKGIKPLAKFVDGEGRFPDVMLRYFQMFSLPGVWCGVTRSWQPARLERCTTSISRFQAKNGASRL